MLGRGRCLINVEELSERLRHNPDLIIKVLVKLDFPEDKIKYNASKRLITSTRPDPTSDNDHAFLLWSDSLYYMFTTRSGQGNIYTLVMDLKHVKFPQALRMVAKWIGFEIKDDVHVKLPFGGFYKNLLTDTDQVDTELKVYDESLLPPPACNLRFKRDGISYCTQEKFDLRFDCDNNAILIPIYNTNLELVGCKARKNEDVKSGKYWAELPFQKTSVVYGLAQNYRSIVSKKKLIIFEAEKSVMQCADFDCNIAVAVMGHDISRAQAKIIKSLMCDEIYIAFDEGVSEEEIKLAASKVSVNTALYKNKVYYLYGGMAKGSKASPSDFGKDTFQRLISLKKKYKGGE